MLGVFSGEVVEAPAELVTAGSRTPSPKTRASELVNQFTSRSAPAVSVQIGSLVTLAYAENQMERKKRFVIELQICNQNLLPLIFITTNTLFIGLQSRINRSTDPYSPAHVPTFYFKITSFAAKDDVYCVFEGVLDNLGSLRHQYGLSKSTNESVLLIEAYKALCDRAPHPPSFMLGLLDGTFAFVLFDATGSTLLVASGGKVPLFWGITSDGYVAFADDLDLLKGTCGKALAPLHHSHKDVSIQMLLEG